MFTKKIWTRIAIAVVVIVVLIFMYRKFTKKSDYVIPPTPASDANSARQTSYSSNLASCETVYINAMNTPGSDATATNTTLNECITSNLMMYYNARCPFLPNNGSSGAVGALTAGSTGANIPIGGSSNVAYMAYKADIDAINAVYVPLISAAGQVYSVNVMQAARKADFTGASRKYFATLCPDIYSNASSTALTTQYMGWTSTATSGSTYGFQASRVTTSNIWQWAIHAGQPPIVTDTTYIAPTATLIGPPTTLGSCSNSDFLSLTNGVPYWQIAADNGPGTVNSAVTFPWAVSSSIICPASASLIPTATPANPLP
jgi:hypothetical protein